MLNLEDKARLDLINIDEQQTEDFDQKPQMVKWLANRRLHPPTHLSIRLPEYIPLRHSSFRHTSNLLRQPKQSTSAAGTSVSLPQLAMKRHEHQKRLKEMYQKLGQKQQRSKQIARRKRSLVSEKSKQIDKVSQLNQNLDAYTQDSSFMSGLTIRRRRTVIDYMANRTRVKNLTPYD